VRHRPAVLAFAAILVGAACGLVLIEGALQAPSGFTGHPGPEAASVLAKALASQLSSRFQHSVGS